MENAPLSMKQVQTVMFFAFNYQHDFISIVWKDDKYLAKHLEGKFNSLYEKHGSTGVMMKFIGELDEGNLELLTKYINVVYQ